MYKSTFFLSLLLIAGVVASATHEGLSSGIRKETRVTQSGVVEERSVYIPEMLDKTGSTPSIHLTPTHRLYQGEPETTVVWVDRAHLNAIAEYSAISSEGMHIFTNWMLNNERVSLYFSAGSGVPIWTYYAPDEFVLEVGESWNASVLSAGDGEAGYRWSRYSSSPAWEYNFGEEMRAASASHDGTKVVYLTRTASGGHIYTLSAETGEILWDYGWSGDPSQSLALSEDGSVAAVLTYDSCYVFDEFGQRGGALRVHGAQWPSQVALSGDGNLLVFGDYQQNLRLYEWGGTNYELKWTAHLGTSPYYDWVTAIAISRDGSTILAGTMDFNYRNNCVACYDTSSSTPRWTCHRYGYGIKSVALSADGRMGIAGCEGDTDVVNGYGDAVSVFDMTDSIPILSISDCEAEGGERGSILSVAISDSGDWACASGKAVRSYEWGSGGEVYCIHIGEIITCDVGITSINSPPDKLKRDTTYAVGTTCSNYGEASVSFWTYFNIEDSLGVSIYEDSSEVVNLAPGGSRAVNFGDFTPLSYGWYKLTTWTALDGDGYPGDDTLSTIAWCRHDAVCDCIDNPFYEITVNQFTPVVAKVKNIGAYEDTVTVVITIIDSNETVVYSDTLDTFLSPDESAQLYFSDWTPESVGTYTAYTNAFTSEDYDSLNGICSKPISSTYEIIYDDGSSNMWYYVSSEYHDNKFAVRFTPVIDTPMTLVSARVYVSHNNPFAISVNRDSSGLPGGIVLGPDTVACSSPPEWVEMVYSHPLSSTDDFWVVFHWLSNSPDRPWVGADYDYPCEERSWWYSSAKTSLCRVGYYENEGLLVGKTEKFDDKDGWTNVDDADWMIRALVTPSGANPDIQVSPDSLYFEIMAGEGRNKEDGGFSSRCGTDAHRLIDVKIEASPASGSKISLGDVYHPTFYISDPETLYYDDGSFETGIGLTSSSGFTPDESETYGFATQFSHTPTNLYGLMLYFTEFAGSSFRLYVWDDEGGVPNSGGMPIWVDMDMAAPTADEWFSLALDTLPVPNPFWIGAIYNYIGPTGSPDWRIGYDQNTEDTHTFGNLGGDPDDWSPMSDYGYGYAYGVRAVIGGVGIIQDTAQMWVKNMGNGMLSVTDITWEGSWIKDINPGSFNVPEGDSIQVTVVAANDGLAGGFYYDTLRIASNDADEPVYSEACVLRILTTGVEETHSRFEVFPAYPSPMRSEVSIAYTLPDNIEANLKIYDISGRVIRTFDHLTNVHSPITWHGRDESGRRVPAGIYFCSLFTGNSRSTRKVVKIK
ncbi:hypothetical protein CH333_04865 [candidate division WOR-3 bacterium JGI_Cruoil_03_44_89]|uniref:FlgD/Vpr Ig-like domain-containing protein n=1 Tax=candidate division WOR-3 bacterium JGI_Cruoil_03_44_89 TaxID=1973748 RepID=A0A235BUP6_UNCW3|nr:MAG: hypothetical protein CH333_04865 [candidate division WOR-3 bacterium JGI_Cruoil_03_44_89]